MIRLKHSCRPSNAVTLFTFSRTSRVPGISFRIFIRTTVSSSCVCMIHTQRSLIPAEIRLFLSNSALNSAPGPSLFGLEPVFFVSLETPLKYFNNVEKFRASMFGAAAAAAAAGAAAAAAAAWTDCCM